MHFTYLPGRPIALNFGVRGDITDVLKLLTHVKLYVRSGSVVSDSEF